MNRITQERIVSEENQDKDSDEPDVQDSHISDLEDDANSIDSVESAAIGISLDDIIEGEQDEQGIIEKLGSLNSLSSKHNQHSISGKKDYSDEFSASNFFIKLLIYSLILSAWGLVYFFLDTPLPETIRGSLGSEILMSFLTFMAMISYYQCSNTPCFNTTQKPHVFLNDINTNICKYCQIWKPERTHHCGHCGKCVLKMDHHCPWICNCVGYRNHKSFFLFCFYTGIGSLYYDYRVFHFFFVASTNHIVFKYPGSFLIYCLLCTFIIFPVGLMTLGLSGYHFLLAMNNATTIEHVAGTKLRFPCFPNDFKKTKSVNKYDQGMIANLWTFFGQNYLFWWWPTIPSEIYKGQLFTHKNDMNLDRLEYYSDTKSAKEEAERKRERPTSIKEIDKDYLFRLAEELVNEKNIKFGELIFEYGKRNDDSLQKTGN